MLLTNDALLLKILLLKSKMLNVTKKTKKKRKKRGRWTMPKQKALLFLKSWIDETPLTQFKVCVTRLIIFGLKTFLSTINPLLATQLLKFCYKTTDIHFKSFINFLCLKRIFFLKSSFPNLCDSTEKLLYLAIPMKLVL